MGMEVIVEEAFIDVFCDLVLSSGWMDSESSITRSSYLNP
jgi:hypothetical protein